MLDDKEYPFEISEDGQVIKVELTNQKVSGGNIPDGPGTTDKPSNPDTPNNQNKPNTPNAPSTTNKPSIPNLFAGGNISTGDGRIIGYTIALVSSLGIMIGTNRKKKIK